MKYKIIFSLSFSLKGRWGRSRLKKDKGVGAPTSAARLNERRQGHCVAENVFENAKEIPKTRCKDSHVYMIQHYKDRATHCTAMATTVQMQKQNIVSFQKEIQTAVFLAL